MSEAGYGGYVQFGVKELLQEIKASIAAVDAKLESKADRERVHQLANDIGKLQNQVIQINADTLKREGPVIRDLLAVNKATAERVEEIEQKQLTQYEVEAAVKRGRTQTLSGGLKVLIASNTLLAMAAVVHGFVTG